MVNPLYIFIIALGTAFLLPVFDKLNRKVSLTFFWAALLSIAALSAQHLINPSILDKYNLIYTAGFEPPFSISLRFAEIEAFLLMIVNLTAVLGALYIMDKFLDEKIYPLILYLTLLTGVNGLILSQDIFNIFVFLEITSISLYALIGLNQNRSSLEAGFKYIIASGLASAFLLLGVIYIYRLTGVLDLQSLTADGILSATKTGMIALFLIIIAFLIELKPFPANGWALDVYQAAAPGISALVASIASAAMIAVLYKLLPLLSNNWLILIFVLGIITYTLSNLTGLKQKNAQRLLGYSSIAQMGLLTSVVALSHKLFPGKIVNPFIIEVGAALFINHFLAKAGLFWLAGIIKKKKWKDWSFKNKPVLVILFAIFIFALTGLPPFPGFWAKISLFKQLSLADLTWWLLPLIIGSLLEAVYLMRWFGNALKNSVESEYDERSNKTIPVIFSALILLFTSYLFIPVSLNVSPLFFIPVAAVLFFWLLNFLPAKGQGLFLIIALAAAGWFLYPQLNGFSLIFEFIFIAGGLVISLASLALNKKSEGYFEFLSMLLFSLIAIPLAQNLIEFFLAWEFMTISSWLLVMRGKKGQKPALVYIIFSLTAALMILTAVSLIYAETSSWQISALALLQNSALPVFILMALAFLIKAAALGLHIWLPRAYAESENEVTPVFSALMSKTSIWAFLLLFSYFSFNFTLQIPFLDILGWLGVITAFFGALFAVFQEDIKYLLAYSSISQIGYMLLALAVNSHLGWATSLYLAVTHLFFKGMLFLAIAGIYSRLKTTKMYEMGGLIKRMPFTFISVLIAIIAVSGVPPLSGFGGKWLLYTSLLEKGWYLQAGLSFFAGAVAFLYLFRLIHTIFLGQMKPAFRHIKEASIWYLIPQYIFIIAIMAVSMFPNLILKPIFSAVETQFLSQVEWEGYKVISSLGYWNGNAIMMITMGVFMLPLVWLLIRSRNVQKVKQFNIVYAAERPDKPETTHFAYNFFAHYQKALGFLADSKVTRFWHSVSEWTHSLAAALRHIYTGDPQTYALHIIIYMVIIFTLLGGF